MGKILSLYCNINNNLIPNNPIPYIIRFLITDNNKISNNKYPIYVINELEYDPYIARHKAIKKFIVYRMYILENKANVIINTIMIC